MLEEQQKVHSGDRVDVKKILTLDSIGLENLHDTGNDARKCRYTEAQ